jgi:hypothetical protein
MLAPSPRAVSGAPSHSIIALTAAACFASASTVVRALIPIDDFADARLGV